MTGQRVRQVRELLGLTQTQLAEACDVKQPDISALESGLSAPQPLIVDRLVAATGFSSEWFAAEPLEEFSEGTIRYRKKSKATKKDDRRAVRRLEVAFELVAELSDGLRTPSVSLPHPGLLQDVNDLEGVAIQTRSALDLPEHGPIRHVIRAVERAGAVVVGLPVDFGTSGRAQHHHGVSAWSDVESSRPVIGFSAHDPGDRQRHTIAHEIGHLVLHRGLPEHDRDYEVEASRFAGAFLMPRDDAIEAFLSGVTLKQLAQLKASWGISIASLILRARQVGMIDEKRQESLFKQLSGRGWRTSEPVRVHREEPALLPRLLEAQFGAPIEWLVASRTLGLPPHLLREITFVAGRDRADPTMEPIQLPQRAIGIWA